MSTNEAQSDAEVPCAIKKAREEKDRGLLLVGLFKLSKALFFTAVGLEAMHLVHTDVGELAQRVADALHFSPENHIVATLLDKADLIGHHQLRQAGMASMSYAALCLVEGYGLMRCKVWAEYLTVVLTTLALPWEIYEMVHHFTWVKVVIFLSNIGILLYLLWVLKKKRAKGAQDLVQA